MKKHYILQSKTKTNEKNVTVLTFFNTWLSIYLNSWILLSASDSIS